MTQPFWPDIGPISPERNPPIHPEYYKPSRFVISDISVGLTTLITTIVNHNYVIGQLVRILVPAFYGTYQISGQEGYITSIPAANQVIVSIDSVGYNSFISSPPITTNPPQILAIGDVNTGQKISTGRYTLPSQLSIPGAFEDISPA